MRLQYEQHRKNTKDGKSVAKEAKNIHWKFHPELNEVWCPAELMQDAKCLVVLKNPNCSGYLPQVASVIQPVGTILIAQVLWMRDFCRACNISKREIPISDGPGIFSMPKDYLDGFINLNDE